MSEETSDDISAELRVLSRCGKYDERQPTVEGRPIWFYFAELADRIDVACGRKANCPESVQECGFKLDVLRGVNVAAMPDALARIVELAKAWADPGADAAVTLGLIIDKAESALSKPLRNCDVGTEFEQVGRFKEFCHAHFCDHCPCRVDEIDPSHYETDPCPVIWAQLPYDEGTANRGDLCHED